MVKKTLAVFCVVLIVTGLLALHVNADDTSVRVGVDYGYSLLDTSAFVPPKESGAYIFSGKWSCAGTLSTSFESTYDSTSFYFADIRKESLEGMSSGSVTFDFELNDDKCDVSRYSVMRFPISIRGAKIDEKGYSALVTVNTAQGSKYAGLTVESTRSSSALAMVTVDTSDMVGIVSSVRIKVSISDTKRPSQIVTGAPFFEVESDYFEYADRYLTSSFECEQGNVDIKSGAITADNNGNAGFSAGYVGFFENCNGKVYAVVDMTGAQTGDVSMALHYIESRTGEIKETEARRLSMYGENAQYVFPFEISGIITGYSLSISGMQNESGLSFDGIKFCYKGKTVQNDWIGTVSSIERNGELIRFEGSIKRESVKEYSDCDIGFFAVPVGNQSAPTVELDRINITTKFEYTVDTSGKDISLDTYMLMTAIVSPDGWVIPIDLPRYFDSKNAAEKTVSNLGLFGTAAVSVYEANASHVIIDVPLDKIFTLHPENSVDLKYTVNRTNDEDSYDPTRTAYIDREFLKDLDDEIVFYVSAGIRVYFRFVSEIPIGGITYTEIRGENYAVCTSDTEIRHMYAALVSFLAERYKGLDGFVVCSDAARSKMTGTEISSDPVKYAAELAELCRLTYNAASKYISGPTVAVPMSENGDVAIPTLSVLLSDSLNEIGNIPWTLMYCTDDLERDTEVLEFADRMMTEHSLNSFDDTMIFVHLTEESAAGNEDGAKAGEAAELIGRYCEAHTDSSVVFVYLADTSLRNDRTFYSGLKESAGSGYVVESKAVEGDKSNAKGRFDLWDFSDKYYDLGWKTIGVESCVTDYGKYGQNASERVLRAVFPVEDGGSAGIMLVNFDETKDLTVADGITFTIALGAEECEGEATVLFVTGTDDIRAEYYASVTTDGEMRTFTCDLNEFDYRDRIDTVGIMVYSDRKVTLEIKKISLTSSVLDDEGIKDMLYPPEQIIEKKQDNNLTVLVVGISVLLTLATLTLIVRKERDARDADRQNKTKNG